MSEQFFCHQTGEALTVDMQWFRCLQCRQPQKIEFRYDDKPVCQSCASSTGMAVMLNYHRDQAHFLIDQVFGATTKKIDDWLSTKVESVICSALGDSWRLIKGQQQLESAVAAMMPPSHSIPDNLDTIIQEKMEQAIAGAININESTRQSEQQQAALQQQINELQSQLSETSQWQQRAERAERRLQDHEQRRLNEQEVMALEGFRDNGDGTVTQLGSNLIWMRFSLGQHWVDGRVVGEAELMSLNEVKKQIKILNQRKWLNRTNWILPDKNSLLSLVKRSVKPTINHIIFPGTKKQEYWTGSTEYSGYYEKSVNCTVDFEDGKNRNSLDASTQYVRLVSAPK